MVKFTNDMKTYNVNKPQIFLYKGNEVTFLNEENVMVNATEMAKAFNKQPKDFLRLPSTASYLEALSKVRKSPTSDFQAVTTVMGSPESGGGTWMHEDLAIEFARWLSPEFAIWCNDRVKELINHGATALNPESLLDPDYVITVMTALKTERTEKELAQSKVKELEPKALFADSVSSSKDSVLIGELAKILNQNGVKLGQNRLFGWLRENGFLISRGEQRNLPTQRYIEQGLFEIKKTTVNLPEGTAIINSTTKVTGKGQIYFVNKFLNERTKTTPILPVSK